MRRPRASRGVRYAQIREKKAMSLHDVTKTTPRAATAQLMLVLDDTIVNVALPSMQRSLHLATPNLNWVISFYALAFGGLLLAGGRAGDLFGRLRMFRAGSSCSPWPRWPAGS